MANVFDQFDGPKSGANVFDQFDSSNPAPVPQETYDPTAEMSTADKFLAGAGSAVSSLLRGARQRMVDGIDPLGTKEKFGQPQKSPFGPQMQKVMDEHRERNMAERQAEIAALRAEEEEARRLEKPLMNTKAGFLGNVSGNVAATVPAILVPGSGSIQGAAAVGSLLGALQPTVEGESAQENALKSGALSVAGQALVSKVLPAAISYGKRKIAEATTRAAQKAPETAVIKAAQDAGYTMPPSVSGGGVTKRMMESVAGKASVKQASSEANQEVTENLVRRAIGVSADDPLTEGTFSALKRKAWDVYDEVRALGTLKSDATFQNVIRSLKNTPGRLGKNSDIEELVTKLDTGTASADDVVTDIMNLRANAKTRLSKLNTNPASKDLGKAERKAADALEGLIERNLSKSDQARGLLQQFRDARTILGKVNDVERSIKKGQIDIRKLAKTATGKLDPNLKAGAKFAERFPELNQGRVSQVVGGMPLDIFGSVGISALTQDPRFLALAALRPAMRKAVLSKVMQSTPNYQAGAFARMAAGTPKALTGPTAKAFARTVPMSVYLAQE